METEAFCWLESHLGFDDEWRLLPVTDQSVSAPAPSRIGEEFLVVSRFHSLPTRYTPEDAPWWLHSRTVSGVGSPDELDEMACRPYVSAGGVLPSEEVGWTQRRACDQHVGTLLKHRPAGLCMYRSPFVQAPCRGCSVVGRAYVGTLVRTLVGQLEIGEWVRLVHPLLGAETLPCLFLAGEGPSRCVAGDRVASRPVRLLLWYGGWCVVRKGNG